MQSHNFMVIASGPDKGPRREDPHLSSPRAGFDPELSRAARDEILEDNTRGCAGFLEFSEDCKFASYNHT